MAEKKVGYLGPAGTFSNDAAVEYLKRLKDGYSLVAYPTIHSILYAVDSEEIEEGIVPAENSIEGTVSVVLDMLAKEVDLKIRDEIIIPISDDLLAKNEIKFQNIKKIISHPQPLEQCRGWIRKNTPRAEIIASSSTTEAARHIAESKDENICAIASATAAKLYGLKILAKNINDYQDNMTRFIVLAKADSKATGSDKTSIVFSTIADRPGGLYDVLGEFASRGINLTKIESRPSKKALGDYFFFVDMEGHRTDTVISEALKGIVNKVAFMKILGSYPKGVNRHVK